MNRRIITAIFIVSLFSQCDTVTEPTYDGFRINGTVKGALSELLLDSVKVFVAEESDSSMSNNQLFTYSDTLGEYVINFGPGTGPSHEILLFEKDGYISNTYILRNVAVKVDDFSYSLDVFLTQSN